MRKKLKIKNILITVLILFIIIFGGTKYISYRNSNYYKLKVVGYSKTDIKTIEDTLSENQIKIILGKSKLDVMAKLITQKYFIFNNLDRYTAYYDQNKNEYLRNIITIVNTNTDRDFYVNAKNADITKGNLILVNKYYKLSKDYTPKDIVNMSPQYAYANNKITKEVYDSYIDMCQAAKKEAGYTLIATSSYRDYITQETLYNRYKADSGQKQADSVAARPGHSEHQVGLALDIVSYGKNMDNFEDSDEAKWLANNAYKYGFILRYPKDKESITGYSYEPWHYRYVGKDVAYYIFTNNITFDEYYAYFIENKKG